MSAFVPMPESDVFDAVRVALQTGDGVVDKDVFRSIAHYYVETVPAEEIGSSEHLAFIAARDDNMSDADIRTVDEFCHASLNMLAIAQAVGADVHDDTIALVIVTHNTNIALAEERMSRLARFASVDPWSDESLDSFGEWENDLADYTGDDDYDDDDPDGYWFD